jgi:hypothetical protein
MTARCQADARPKLRHRCPLHRCSFNFGCVRRRRFDWACTTAERVRECGWAVTACTSQSWSPSGMSIAGSPSHPLRRAVMSSESATAVASELLQLELDCARADHERAEAEARYRRALLEHSRSRAHPAGVASSLSSLTLPSSINASGVQPSAAVNALVPRPASLSTSSSQPALAPVVSRAALPQPAVHQSPSAATLHAALSSQLSPSLASHARRIVAGGPGFTDSTALLDLASVAL